jgi:molecular chaperone DnaK (HSP70)
LSNSLTVTSPPITPTHETAWKLQKLQLSLVTVVSDFLKSVLEITKTSIEATYDSKFACDSNIEYLLTVPAMWSDSSKKIMIEAAEGAGFGSHRHDFHLISEPECAVAYTLRAIQPDHLNARVHHYLHSLPLLTHD